MTIPHDSMDVHRLLDRAFAGVAMTPERQEFKDEVRANLVARIAELEAGGTPADRAARLAVEELGDLRAIIESAEQVTPWQQRRVRPRPGFVLRTVLFSAIGAGGLATLALAATIAGVPVGGEVAAVLGLAVAAGAITADALRQETTSNHPMPTGRAFAYGAGALLAVAGLGGVWLFVRGDGLGWLIGGAVPVLLAIGLLSYLGATQTNRHKQWLVQMAQTHAAAGDAFTADPAAAARFGLYTIVNWLVTITVFIVLTLTVGWVWSWIAVVGGVVVTMLMIARMLFAPQDGPK
nr:permease prefix domain 1-containing protein [uncultured Actinoplanes sp.]